MPHILIVEDDAATRAAYALLLHGEGYATAEAGDGREAIHSLRSGPRPCLVLLDMMMPVMDGWQFLHARHADPTLATLPVLVITAAGGVAPTTVRALGADDVLAKPVDPQELLDAVRRYCPPPGT